MSSISTHILDTSRGLPAVGVSVMLEQQRMGSWTELSNGVTNDDGRITNLVTAAVTLTTGIYRLHFATATWFQALGMPCFFPEVLIVFQIDDPARHLHVPLLLSPFGYTTYRGS